MCLWFTTFTLLSPNSLKESIISFKISVKFSESCASAVLLHVAS